ncbi:MAG TPA: DinB family protein [Anaerolineae bacterium]|nr:DinB family protein [Anaerolineae bacterium]
MREEKEQRVLGVYSSIEPEIGRWLWALQDARLRTMWVLEGLPPGAIDWPPPDGESSIGTVLYHIAGIEADYLYVEVLEQPMPPEVVALFTHETRDEQGRLVQVLGQSLEQHLGRLDVVRGLLLDVFQVMDLADFRRARSLPDYDMSPEYVLYHLMQHEAEHRSQIGALRARANG